MSTSCLAYSKLGKWRLADWLALRSCFRMRWQMFRSAETENDCWLSRVAPLKPGMSPPANRFRRHSCMRKPFNARFSLLTEQELPPAVAIQQECGIRPPDAKFSRH